MQELWAMRLKPRGIAWVLLFILQVMFIVVFSQPAHAWKPKTHIYIANVIMDDARDGKVWIPPFGEFSITWMARDAVNWADQFRAGAVGPDGFPDMWTGQAFIHPNTDPWVRHLWNSAVSANNGPAWGFTYGYLVHCAGDVFAHDWVNYYAGRAFPSMSEIASDPALLGVVARHLAIETTLDNRISVSNSTISIPYQFILDKMLLDPGAQQAGMNPFIQHYVSLYWEKYPYRNDTIPVFDIPTYNACWFYDLGADLSYWVMANETAMKETVEQGRGMIDALTSNLGEWAFLYILDMEGAPSGTTAVANAILSLSSAISAALDALGLSAIMDNIKDTFVDWMLQATMGMTAEQLKSYLLAEANTTLFPNNLNEILNEIGYIPPESQWIHDNNAHALFQQFVRGINGALYNSVIMGKIALLGQDELDRLTRSTYYARTGFANAMLGCIKGIDFSSQWLPGSGWGGFLGYQQATDFPTFTYLFKPYPPLNRTDGTKWVRQGTVLPVKLEVTVTAPDGTGAYGTRGSQPLYYRKASDRTSPWYSTIGFIDQNIMTTPELSLEYGTEYIFRAVSGDLNFPGSVSVTFDTPVDLLRKRLAFRASAAVTYNPSDYGSLLAPSTPGNVWLWGQIETPEQTPDGYLWLAAEGNSMGLPSTFSLKLPGCRLRMDGNYGPLLAGMTGVLIISPRDQSIVPATPVKIEFTTDMEGNARWGCRNLDEAMRGSDQVTVKVGSHPGTLTVRALLNVTDASLAGAKVAEGYRRVQAVLNALPASQSGADIQGVSQTFSNLPRTIGTPATAETNMRTAIAGVANAQVKQNLQQSFDSGLAQFPTMVDRGFVPVTGSSYIVQPDISGPDSNAVSPSFSAPLPPPPLPPQTTIPEPQQPAQPKPTGTTPVQPKPVTMPTGPVVQKPETITPPTTPPTTPPVQPKPVTKPTEPVVQEPEVIAPPTTPPAPKPKPIVPPAPQPKVTPRPTVPHVRPPLAGVFGGERVLGARSQLKFTLNSAEYTVATVRNGDSVIFPLAEEKLLVVHFTLRNAQAEDTWVSWDTVSFTAVDAMGMNREYCQNILNEQTGETVDASLLPNQTIDCYTVITMPARGPALTLLARAADGAPLEFSLRNAVASLEPPIADLADPAGATALTEVPAEMGVAYSLGNFVVTVDRGDYIQEAILREAPQEGARFLMFTLRLKNQTSADQPLSGGAFGFSLRGPQGDEIPWNGYMLAPNRDQEIDIAAAPGKVTTVRIYFEVPAGMQPTALFVREGVEGRAYLVNISGAR
jgi:hypothetical protein